MNKWELFSGLFFLLNRLKLRGLALPDTVLHVSYFSAKLENTLRFERTFYVPSLRITRAPRFWSSTFYPLPQPRWATTSPRPRPGLPSWQGSCPPPDAQPLAQSVRGLFSRSASPCCLFVWIRALAVPWVQMNSRLPHLCLCHRATSSALCPCLGFSFLF